MKTLKQLHQHVDILLEQITDLYLLQKYPDTQFYSKTSPLYQMWRNTYLNMRQRERFLACAYADNSEDALNALLKLEK